MDFIAVAPVTTLEQTVNYAAVYEIIRHRMQSATPLLETLVQELTDEIYAHDKRIKSISVTVEKKNPPMSAFEGSVSVNFKKDF
jgi:dihydroneopterin aldolase